MLPGLQCDNGALCALRGRPVTLLCRSRNTMMLNLHSCRQNVRSLASRANLHEKQKVETQICTSSMKGNIKDVHEGSCTAAPLLQQPEGYIMRQAFGNLKLRGVNFELHHETPVCPNTDLGRPETTKKSKPPGASPSEDHRIISPQVLPQRRAADE
jgi:hypothetical protein